MKNLTKKLTIVIVALFMVLVNAKIVYGVTESQINEQTATVTVEKVEDGTTLKLYKIVEPDIDANTKELKGYKFTSTADGVLIGPKKDVTLTNKNDSSDTRTVKAGEVDQNTNKYILDQNEDGIIDDEVTINNVVYTVGTYKNDSDTTAPAAGKVLYDMEAPNATSVNLAVAKGAIGSNPETAVANGTDYVQKAVKTGQYIGILTPPEGSKTIYNPIVLSAGYKGLPKYTNVIPNGKTATHYRRLDGTFVLDAPTSETKHLYYPDEWDNTNNVKTGPLWIADGETTEDQLIAGNVDPSKNYNTPIQGTTGVVKKSTPSLLKEATTDYYEEGKDVPVVASLENGDPKYVTNQTSSSDNPEPDSIQLVYIKAPANPTIYNNVRDGLKNYKLVNGVYEECEKSDTAKVSLSDLETLDAHKACTTSKRVYSAAQGERIDYTLTPVVPQYPLNAKNRTFVITDKMGDGISFTSGSIELKYEDNNPEIVTSYDIDEEVQYKFYIDTGKTYSDDVNADDKYFLDGSIWKKVNSKANPAVVPTPGAKLYDLLAEATEQKTDGTLVNGNNFQINFKYNALKGVEGQKSAPKVYYNATINENAIKGISGNVNVATVYFAKNSGQGSTWEKWTKPSGDDYTEWHDEGVVYTYEIKFRKTNDKDEHVEDENGTLFVLKEVDQTGWAADKVAAYQKFVEAAIPSYDADATKDQYGRINPSRLLIDSTKEPYTNSDYASYLSDFVDNTKKYKSNLGTENDNFKVLKDAVFGLYKTVDCKEEDKVAEIKTNDDGFGHTTLTHGGTYYLKEITPPTGYSLNTTVYEVTPEWTSCTTWSTDSVRRYVYSVVEYTTEEWADPNKHTHTGWLVADTESSTKGKYYDMNGNAPSAEDNTEEDGRYFGHGNGDGVTAWKYDYTNKTMTKGNVVVKYVFPAIVDKQTETTTDSDTVYNNNGGTLLLARVNNTKTSELPSTGGIGTYLFTIAGVAIIATAAFMLIFRKKEEHNH